MKTKHPLPARCLVLAMIYCLAAPLLRAFEVDTGSDESDGALNITENTSLTLPPDGIFNFTTVDVAEGATLTFVRNAANTGVHILATGTITVNGTISVDGERGRSPLAGAGGPGGWSGGNQAQPGLGAGAGKGPGGGTVGSYGSPGSYASGPTFNASSAGPTYGSLLLIPLMGGSGGGGGSSFSGGGGGGGAILLASDTGIILNGRVSALGGPTFGTSSAPSNPGSGGGIRLLAPTVSGTGTVDARGGWQSYTGISKRGGDGYIRIDAGSFTPEALGVVTQGRNTLIFPENPPSLRIVSVAGSAIPENDNSEAYVNLPANRQPVQPVVVRASHFDAEVAIKILLVPESGAATVFEGTIDNRFADSVEQTFSVTFPLNTLVHVNVFTAQTINSN